MNAISHCNLNIYKYINNTINISNNLFELFTYNMYIHHTHVLIILPHVIQYENLLPRLYVQFYHFNLDKGFTCIFTRTGKQ